MADIETQQDILKAMDILIKSALKNYTIKNFEAGKVTAINGKIATVQVGANTTTCIIPKNISVVVGDGVGMFIANGNYSEKYIILVY